VSLTNIKTVPKPPAAVIYLNYL